MKPSLAKEVVRFASVRATQNGALQELSELEAALEGSCARRWLGREASRMPASARQSQNVPVSYPQSVELSPFTGNATCPFAGLLCKPSDGLEPSTPSL